MAAILDRTKILLDVNQSPIISHNCAQYKWDPIIHVWEWAVEWFPYVKYMDKPVGDRALTCDVVLYNIYQYKLQ